MTPIAVEQASLRFFMTTEVILASQNSISQKQRRTRERSKQLFAICSMSLQILTFPIEKIYCG
jgi:hypothetical protein